MKETPDYEALLMDCLAEAVINGIEVKTVMCSKAVCDALGGEGCEIFGPGGPVKIRFVPSLTDTFFALVQ